MHGCPDNCKCLYTTVSCHYAQLKVENLTTIAEQISNKTEVLYFSGNLFEEFPIEKIRHLTKLRQLDLRDNKLKEVPDNKNSYLPELTELNLQGNLISVVKEELFVGYTNLKTLFSQDNNIKVIPDNAFKKLENLRNMYLENNKIDTLTALSFNGLKTLSYLSLGDNLIKTLPNGVFNRTKLLIHLFLHGNELTRVPKDLFIENTNIIHIDFSGNRIDEIEENALDMKNIETADIVLSNNFLKTLDTRYFGNSKNLRIDFSENVLNCDKNLIKTKNYLSRKYKYIELLAARCVTPSELYDRPLDSIKLTEIDCVPCDVQSCENNGICVNKNDSNFMCNCPKGFTSTYCEQKQKIYINACANHNCLNNGTCHVKIDNTYMCKCPEQNKGEFCEKTIKKPSSEIPLSTYIAIMSGLIVCLLAMVIILTCFYNRKRREKKHSILLQNIHDTL